MSTKLKPITETSWLVINDSNDNRVGLLTEMRDQYILMIKGEKQHFINRKEVNKFFNEDVFSNIDEVVTDSDVKKDYYINGFPVDFDNPKEVILKGNTLPLFCKKATSDVYYSAGYYCLFFKKNIMPAFCPKLATLKEYQYAGPFKDEFEMKLELTRLRKLRNKAI